MKLARKPKFGLRTLLIVFLLVTVVVGLVGSRWYRKHLQEQAIVAIGEMGGLMVKNKNKDAVRVMFRGTGFNDETLELALPHLRRLPELVELDLVQTSMTDKAIEHLLQVDQVDEIYLFESGMTPEGIENARRLMPNVAIKTEMPEIIATGMASMNVYGHAIVGLDWSPDGALLATGSGDGVIRIWDLQSADPCIQWQAHEDWTFAVAWSADGKSIATGGGDNAIRIWSSSTGELTSELLGHTDDVHSICFTPDGKSLVSAGDDKVIRFWDLATQNETRKLQGHSAQIPAIAISPSGQRIASASRDDTIRVWDVESGKKLAVLTTDSFDVNSVAFDSTGKFLASGDQGGNVTVWDLDSWQPHVSYAAHRGKVYSVKFNPADNQLASCGDDGVKIRDILNGKHSSSASLAAVEKTGGANMAEALTSNNDQARTIGKPQKFVSNVAYHPRHEILATTSAAGEVHLIDLEKRETVKILRTMYGERGFDFPVN